MLLRLGAPWPCGRWMPSVLWPPRSTSRPCAGGLQIDRGAGPAQGAARAEPEGIRAGPQKSHRRQPRSGHGRTSAKGWESKQLMKAPARPGSWALPLRTTAAMLACVATLAATSPAAAAVVTYPAPPGEKASADYQVAADGKPVFVYTASVLSGGPASFAYFDFSGSVVVTVTLPEKIRSVKILPLVVRHPSDRRGEQSLVQARQARESDDRTGWQDRAAAASVCQSARERSAQCRKQGRDLLRPRRA